MFLYMKEFIRKVYFRDCIPHTVKPGERMLDIARKYYGEENVFINAIRLSRFNGITGDFSKFYPGRVIYIPKEGVIKVKNTCVSMSCPFILVCKEYNFLVDRGEKCEIQENILRQAKKLEKQRRKAERLKRNPGE